MIGAALLSFDPTLPIRWDPECVSAPSKTSLTFVRERPAVSAVELNASVSPSASLRRTRTVKSRSEILRPRRPTFEGQRGSRQSRRALAAEPQALL